MNYTRFTLKSKATGQVQQIFEIDMNAPWPPRQVRRRLVVWMVRMLALENEPVTIHVSVGDAVEEGVR